MTDLTKAKQPNKVSWNDEADKAFIQLKQALCKAPILKLPDVNRPFVLRTDASDTGLGAMLLQENNGVLFPVAFASKKLNPTQRRYSVVERECLAIVWGLEKFHLYLYGRSFIVQCDQRSLKFLNTAKLTNNRVMRWALKVQPYRFRVESIPGIDNIGADYLSRME